MKGILTSVAGFAVLLFLGTSVSADIYRYKDKNGVWHFTNIKTDNRYTIYIRDSRKMPPEDYIREYDDIIIQASKTFGVEHSLIKAVIRAESAFDRQAVSSKGAKGLMQLMPPTAEAMKVEDPFDAEENIFGGTRYLSVLLKRFKNNKELALAAYNAGPEKVESNQGIPPIPETETFVKKVIEYYQSYKTWSE